MFKITTKSKYRDLSSYSKIYYVLAVGIFISILSFVLYQGFIVTLTMVVCTIVAYILLSRKPRDILIIMNEKGLTVDEDFIEWNNCIGWASVELSDGTLEFVVETTTLRKRFWYFYMSPTQRGMKEFILELGKFLPYMEDIPAKDLVHNIMKN
ncbi:hypothetical protein HC766_08870 [Candidatus Gracilibacteria bacterium]|nr:hypothetical protein [Candidatus Gracilibacteria bacterium]